MAVVIMTAIYYCGNVIGLAFSFQEVANLPVEPFDLPIKKIINEK